MNQPSANLGAVNVLFVSTSLQASVAISLSDKAVLSSAVVKDPKDVVQLQAGAVIAPVKAILLKASAFTSIVTPSTATSRVLPVLVRAFQAVICQAPENCVKLIAVVHTVIGSFVVHTYQLLSFVLHSSTKANHQDISAPVSKLVDLVST